MIVVADSSYACYHLLDAVRASVCMITPLRLDARLFDDPPAQPAGKRGPKPKIGKRQPTLQQRLADPATEWQTLVIAQWYGQRNKVMQVTTQTALWYKSNDPLVPLRWVLIKDPSGQKAPMALLSTDLALDAQSIINFFIRRWTLEVTYEEVRRHLGVESQRQWSELAIARTTPVLMGLLSIVTLWAHQLQKHKGIKAQTSAWYQKLHPTFSDAIVLVRQQIWQSQKFLTSSHPTEVNNLNQPLIYHLCDIVARTA
jgi:DDE superfamily endonuclease